MHLLIPYIQLRPPDPALDEFTYGDVRSRARKLKSTLIKGDYVFFHTSWAGKKYITAYFIVDRVLDTAEACADKAIKSKYKNPHILEFLVQGSRFNEDVVLFGDPIKSRVLDKPLLFDSKLANKLSLNIKFPTNRSDSQVIGSATRSWRQLTDRDINILLKAIGAEKKRSYLRSTEEVAETIEKDVEDYIANNPSLIGKGFRLSERQLPIESGRIDLLFEDGKGDLTVVEVKLNRIGRDALQQIQRYIHELRIMEKGKKIHGVIVCSEVMPAYANDLRKQRDIRILIYGWDMKVHQWQLLPSIHP